MIDPAGFSTRPQDPLATAVFALALVSPAFPAARLDASRPVLRAGSTRVVPVLDGVTYEGPPEPAEAHAPAGPPPSVPSREAAYMNPPPAGQPVVIINAPQAEPPAEIYYPVPVYTGIIVVNPPEYKGKTKKPAQAVSSGGKANAVTPPAAGSIGPNIPRGGETPHRPAEPSRPQPPDAGKPVN